MKESNVTENQIVEGKKISFDITDCSLYLGILTALAAIASTIDTKKKNQKLSQDPYFETFSSKDEYEKFIADFQKTKNEYEGKSKFKKVLHKLGQTVLRKREDRLQELTEEQKNFIIERMKKINTNEYTYSSTDQLEIINGKFIVTKEDGTKLDITTIIIPEIYEVGKGNNVIATGIMTDELKEGRNR